MTENEQTYGDLTILLNDQWYTEEISMEIKRLPEANEN
jgi:hypothetical protein